MATNNDDTAEAKIDPEVVEKLNELGADGIDELVPTNATRRQALSAIGGAVLGGAAAGTASADAAGSGQHSLTAGAMALDEATQVAPGMYLGPTTAKSSVDPEESHVFLAYDYGERDEYRWFYGDGSTWLDNGWSAPEATVGSLDTEEAAIGRFGSTADYTFVSYDGPLYAAIDRNNTVQFEDSSFSTVLQAAIDDRNGKETHFHFDNPRGRGLGSYVFDSAVTCDLHSTMWTGGGRNKSQLTRFDGDTNDLLIFDTGDGSLTPLHEFHGLKFTGNGDAGSAIINRTANEINMDFVEVRSFGDYGFKFEPQNEMQWNNFHNVWFLDCGKAGVYVGTGGDSVTELNFIGSTLCGGPEGSVSDGQHGLHFANGSGARNANLTGVTLKGSEPVLVENGTDVNVVGGQAKDVMGDYAISIGEGTGTAFDVNIKNMVFRADGTSPVTNAIRCGSNANNVTLAGNDFYGIAGTEVVNNAPAGEVTTRNNFNFSTKAKSIETFASGSNSRTFPTEMSTDPQDGDVIAIPTSGWNSSAATKYEVYASSVTDGYGIRMDADPTQDVDFLVIEEKTTLA